MLASCIRNWWTVAACTATVSLVTASAAAQAPGPFSPLLRVPVEHPARVPLHDGTKIAVFPFDGTCGAELSDQLNSVLTNSKKFEVLDRTNTAKLLGEQDFHFSGRIDPSTATRMGQVLGPAVVIFGRVDTCTTNVNTGLEENTPRGILHVSKTKVAFSATVSVEDLKTGRDLGGGPFDGSTELENKNANGVPEAPDEHQVMLLAYSKWINQASHLFLPWTTTAEFKVHNDDPKDKTWSLKRGADLLKSGQFDAAAAELKNVVDQHQTATGPDADKYMPKALYDLGIALTYTDHPEDGVKALQDSNLRHPDPKISDDIDKAKAIIATRQAFAAQTAATHAAPPATVPSATPPPPQVAPPSPPAATEPVAAVKAAPSAGRQQTRASASPAAAIPAQGTGPVTVAQAQTQIDELKAQRSKGLITPAEFDARRSDILRRCAACGVH